MAITLRPTRRRASLAVRLLWLLAILAALYTAAWFGAVALARSYAGAWLKREAGKGRQWTCDTPEISGFPFNLRLACNSPALSVAGDGGASSYAAKTLFAHVDFFAPTQLHVSLGPPLNLKLRNGDAVLLNARDVKGVAGLAVGGIDTALRSLVRSPGTGTRSSTSSRKPSTISRSATSGGMPLLSR